MSSDGQEVLSNKEVKISDASNMTVVPKPPKKLHRRSRDSVTLPPAKHKEGVTPRHKKPGTNALREIRALQKSTRLLFPKAAIQRVVREIAQNHQAAANRDGLHFEKQSMNAFHEASENRLLRVMTRAQEIAINRGRKGIQKKDFLLAYKQMDE